MTTCYRRTWTESVEYDEIASIVDGSSVSELRDDVDTLPGKILNPPSP